MKYYHMFIRMNKRKSFAGEDTDQFEHSCNAKWCHHFGKQKQFGSFLER